MRNPGRGRESSWAAPTLNSAALSSAGREEVTPGASFGVDASASSTGPQTPPWDGMRSVVSGGGPTWVHPLGPSSQAGAPRRPCRGRGSPGSRARSRSGSEPEHRCRATIDDTDSGCAGWSNARLAGDQHRCRPHQRDQRDEQPPCGRSAGTSAHRPPHGPMPRGNAGCTHGLRGVLPTPGIGL